ncbi:four-jointed box protein 1 [Ambystoma mexicanum]|uniref:four-jointed box protein 1 n=1 Tax=Ambystoma mexicanum TaxID=8296 RepID=UPI0037E9BCB5
MKPALCVHSAAVPLLFLLSCALVVWTGLQGTAEKPQGLRTKRSQSAGWVGPQAPLPNTFRALLTVPADGIASLDLAAKDRRSVVEDGIFWGSRLVEAAPAGFSASQVASWMARARASRIISLEKGCGRSSNRLARFSDGTKACVRYGINPEQIQGETFSFYLSRLLGIENVPPLALSRVNPNSPQWGQVRTELLGSQWTEGAIVSLTPWIDNLTDLVAPSALRPEDGRLRQVRADVENRTGAELLELVQWTDLIVFDYLTANFDRLVSNLFSLQWDPRVMQRATSNLHRAPNGGLVFIDNEAGLVHGYRVRAMWDKYNEPLLRAVCLFRRGLAGRIRELHGRGSAAAELHRLYREHEPLASELGGLSEDQARLLQDRLELVYKHILVCQAAYR